MQGAGVVGVGRGWKLEPQRRLVCPDGTLILHVQLPHGRRWSWPVKQT